jgi:transposase-like protein
LYTLDTGPMALEVPRDRNGSFAPQLPAFCAKKRGDHRG